MMERAIKEGKLRIEWKIDHWKSTWVHNTRKDHFGQEFVVYFPFWQWGETKKIVQVEAEGLSPAGEHGDDKNTKYLYGIDCVPSMDLNII